SLLVIALVLAAFAWFVYGVFALGWDFTQMAALFFLMGVVAGIAGGLGVAGTSAAFVDGFRGMAYAALLIGFARAITVVLAEGKIVDTIVHGLFMPLAGLPVLASAAGMMGVHTALHFRCPASAARRCLRCRCSFRSPI